MEQCVEILRLVVRLGLSVRSNMCVNGLQAACGHTKSLNAGSLKCAGIRGAVLAESKPEDAIREMMSGMFALDESAVRRVILPNPNAEVLWTGQPVPTDRREGLKTSIAQMTFRELRPGERVRCPAGERLW